jgi:hypothetical protein
MPAVISVEATNLLTVSDGEWITMCPLCEAKVADMHSHISQHILRALSNTPESVALKELVCFFFYNYCTLILSHVLEVGNVLPCGFCGCSGLPECSVTIKVPASSPPVWETKCIFQHAFKYGFADTGSKNKPCRNVPLKCVLCHPALPPEPGKSIRRMPVIFIDAVWRYNMITHILNEHEEYSVPGHRVSGVALPAVAWMSAKLTELEQSASHIAKEHWQVGKADDKENMPASGSHARKCPTLKSTGSLLIFNIVIEHSIVIAHTFVIVYFHSRTLYVSLISLSLRIANTSAVLFTTLRYVFSFLHAVSVSSHNVSRT